MAELKCSNCGTAYDTDGFEPGQRFRCHGDGCSEKLTVPGAGAIPPSVSDTPTPAPIKAAAPVSNYADDDDVLEAKAPVGAGSKGGKGKKRRSQSGRREAPPADDGRGGGRRGNVQAAPSQAPMYAAIGGVALLLVIVAIVMLSAPVDSKSGTKAPPKPRFKPADPVDFKKKPGGDATTGGDDAGTETAVPADAKPKPVSKPRKSKYDFVFVEDAGFQPAFQKFLQQMYHDDPNVAQEAEQGLFDAGSKAQLCNAILNHLPKMDFGKIEDRTVASFLMNIVGDALGDDVKVAVGDVAVVTPNMNGKLGYVDAMRAWREYWKNNGGTLLPEKE